MRRLRPPTFAVRDVIEACLAGITEEARVAQLRGVRSVIESAEHEYRALGEQGGLYQMPLGEAESRVDRGFMSIIYKRHFVRRGSPSRVLYEQIRMAPEHGTCPLCGQRTVSTIDHYLPQVRYPELTLTPMNMVPACSDCNKAKLAQTPQTAEEQSLHPYFDDLGQERWLVAEVLPSQPPTIAFSIRAASDWSATLTARVKYHFAMLSLAELYAAQAASEMADISYTLVMLGDAVGGDGVHDHLDLAARSRAHRNRNSWQAALYEALAASEWFCGVGYRLGAPARVSGQAETGVPVALQDPGA